MHRNKSQNEDLKDVSLSVLCYLNVDGFLSETCQYKIPDEELIKGYKVMLLTRHIDERMITLQRQGTISFAMSSLGEEGCVVASAAALKLEDWIYPQYREDGVMFWRGYTPQEYIHHMFGNAKDSILGRQMPNHFGSRALNVVTVSSPLATQIPHAAGAAYGMKLKGMDSVVLCYFGDGVTSKGDFHVGLNIAALKKVPCIFFCRNNQYAISTRTNHQFVTETIAHKGLAYGIKSCRVDGNDYFAVHEATTEARQRCLAGEGPVLIEAVTYRLGAHSTSDDPSVYRTDDEVNQWRAKDPVLRLRAYLKQQKLWDDEKEKFYLADIKREVDQAIATAKNTPKPPLKSLVEDVYFEVPRSLREQLAELRTFFPEE